jgi:hypothetical protein
MKKSTKFELEFGESPASSELVPTRPAPASRSCVVFCKTEFLFFPGSREPTIVGAPSVWRHHPSHRDHAAAWLNGQSVALSKREIASSDPNGALLP